MAGRDHHPANRLLFFYEIRNCRSRRRFAREDHSQAVACENLRGSSRKLIIYKHKDKPGWFFDPQYKDEQEALQSFT